MRKKGYFLLSLLIILSQYIYTEPLGDANGDGQVDIVDALVVAQHYVGLTNNEIILINSDVNADNAIDIIDALLIAQYYVNIISCFPPECSTTPSPPIDILISVEGCIDPPSTSTKEFTTRKEITAEYECIRFTYNEAEQILHVSHIHSDDNCCLKPAGDITIDGNTIEIYEWSVGDTPCHCLCLFNLNYEIRNMVPDIYTIIVRGVSDLTFTLDLSTENEGVHCVFRDTYPWIIY